MARVITAALCLSMPMRTSEADISCLLMDDVGHAIVSLGLVNVRESSQIEHVISRYSDKDARFHQIEHLAPLATMRVRLATAAGGREFLHSCYNGSTSGAGWLGAELASFVETTAQPAAPCIPQAAARAAAMATLRWSMAAYGNIGDAELAQLGAAWLAGGGRDATTSAALVDEILQPTLAFERIAALPVDWPGHAAANDSSVGGLWISEPVCSLCTSPHVTVHIHTHRPAPGTVGS